MMKINYATIYTQPDCPYCDATRSLLDWNEISFNEVDITKISDNEIKSDSIFKDGTFPIIIIDGIHIGSYQQLVDYIAKEQN